MAEHFPLSDPILADYTTVNKIACKSDVETDDPWVKKLAIAAMSDPEYVAMIAHRAIYRTGRHSKGK